MSIYIFNILIIDHDCNDIFNIKLSHEYSKKEVEEVLEGALGFFHELEVRAHAPWGSWRDSDVWVRG